MPRFRSDISAFRPYVPGRTIEEVAAAIGMEAYEIVKLASNESPDGPFPGVVEAAVEALADSNRYPDNDNRELSFALSRWLDVPVDSLWFGNGSVALLSHIGMAVGGPGTSSVYAWPSFVMYRTVSRWALTETIEVPLVEHNHDLDSMRDAVRSDTSVIYLCNPNNPTGTVLSAGAVGRFIESVPESVLVVIDEAYHEYVTDDSHSTAIPHAVERPNVVVLRTFSKIFSLAAHRVGYGVAAPGTIAELRKAQAPFSVTSVAQAAAAASLDDRSELSRRIEANAAARHHLLGVLTERGLAHSQSQANFVYLELGEPASESSAKFAELGVIVRPMSGAWLRVTIGGEEDNRRFASALDQVLAQI
jgi:histidinol-phosphate aminotransferase